MAYTINLTDGTIFAVVEDGTVDNTSSITLIGKNVANYGELLDENYIQLLESHATDNTGIPTAPLTGQVWFDKTAGTLKVFNGLVFKNLGSASPAGTEPPGAESAVGNIWFNTATEHTYIYNGTDYVLIGTTTPLGTGLSDPVVTTISDGGTDHTVVEYYVDGIRVGITSGDAEFTPSPAETGFATIKPGNNLSTDIAGTVFNGTATDADALGGALAVNYLRSDQNDSTSGVLSILNDAGLIIGATGDAQFSVSGLDLHLRNIQLGGDLDLQLNNGVGGVATPLTISASTLRARTPDDPIGPADIVNRGYLEANFVALAGGDMTGPLSFIDNIEIRMGNDDDFTLSHNAGITLLANDTGDLNITSTAGDIRLTAGGNNSTVWVYGGTEGKVCAALGQGDERVTLYYDGSDKLNTLIDGISVTGNVTVSNLTPGLDSHLVTKSYVDGKFTAMDSPDIYTLSIRNDSLQAWTTHTINANAKFAFVSAYVYGIFDTAGGQVMFFARKPGLPHTAAGLRHECVSTGSSSGDAGSGTSSVMAGSSWIECNGLGQIETYAYRSSLSIIAPSAQMVVKGWIE